MLSTEVFLYKIHCAYALYSKASSVLLFRTRYHYLSYQHCFKNCLTIDGGRTKLLQHEQKIISTIGLHSGLLVCLKIAVNPIKKEGSVHTTAMFNLFSQVFELKFDFYLFVFSHVILSQFCLRLPFFLMLVLWSCGGTPYHWKVGIVLGFSG